MPEHAGDNWHDMGKIGPPSWKLRPLEVSRAIDAVGRDARFAALLDLNRVGDAQWHGHTDPRIQAAVAGVPFAADFDLATLAAPRIYRLLADPPGFNRAELPALYGRVAAFFQKHLLP